MLQCVLMYSAGWEFCLCPLGIKKVELWYVRYGVERV